MRAAIQQRVASCPRSFLPLQGASLFRSTMSQWGGDGLPLAPPSDSTHQPLHTDISFIILSLAMITQQLSAVLASQLSSSLSPASPSTSNWLLQALTNISNITYYLSLLYY